MSGALAVVDDLPDLLGTAPSDLLPNTDEFADVITARQRAERIRAHLIAYAEMRQDIADAFAFRDWAALGYSSWYAYLAGEFGPELQALARRRADRQAAVRDLRAGGLSTRQIAGVLDVDAKTVRNDLAGTASPAEVTGADGKTYPARRQPPPAATDTPAAATADDESPAGTTGAADAAQETPAASLEPAGLSPSSGWPVDPAVRDAEEAATTAAFPAGTWVCWADGPDERRGEVRTVYPGGRALWVVDERGFGHTVAPSAAAVIDSPAGRDHLGETDSGEAGSAAVATPGQPGPAGPPAFVQPVAPAERRTRIDADLRSLAAVVVDLLELAAADPADLPLDDLRAQRDSLNLLIRRLERKEQP